MKKTLSLLLITSILSMLSTNAYSQENNKVEDEKTKSYFVDMSLEDLLDIELMKQKLTFYGYFDTTLEKSINVAELDKSGKTIYKDSSMEWSTPNFHIYGSTNLNDNIDVLLNLARDNENIEIRNAWGNLKVNDLLQFKFGKMYRRFDLFNERLDQIPTFLGIEPPELFDKDHLIVPRTTNFMIHGKKTFNDSSISYSISTENPEGGAESNALPLGWDLRSELKTDISFLGNPSFLVGTSGYISSLNENKSPSSVDLGQGYPKGGILPWMSKDKYTVFGGFLETVLFNNLLIQCAYWQSNHQAERNPNSILDLINNGSINSKQKDRFLVKDALTKDSKSLSEQDVISTANYNIQTYYLRFGYSINSEIGSFTPYLLFDWMSNPETIRTKKYGGDDEAGYSDNGVFFKPSLGIVYKPTDSVAVKIDSSLHTQKFNGKEESYPEFRGNISFAFK